MLGSLCPPARLSVSRGQLGRQMGRRDRDAPFFADFKEWGEEEEEGTGRPMPAA